VIISIQTIPGSGGHGGCPSCRALCYRIRKSEEKVMRFMLIGNDVTKRWDKGREGKRKGRREEGK